MPNIKVSEASVDRLKENPIFFQLEPIRQHDYLKLGQKVMSPKILKYTEEPTADSFTSNLGFKPSFAVNSRNSRDRSSSTSQAEDSAKKLIAELYKNDYHKYKAQIRMTIDKGKEMGRTFNNLVEKKLHFTNNP